MKQRHLRSLIWTTTKTTTTITTTTLTERNQNLLGACQRFPVWFHAVCLYICEGMVPSKRVNTYFNNSAYTKESHHLFVLHLQIGHNVLFTTIAVQGILDICVPIALSSISVTSWMIICMNYIFCLETLVHLAYVHIVFDPENNTVEWLMFNVNIRSFEKCVICMYVINEYICFIHGPCFNIINPLTRVLFY